MKRDEEARPRRALARIAALGDVALAFLLTLLAVDFGVPRGDERRLVGHEPVPPVEPSSAGHTDDDGSSL
jgi:hypothetical protein